MGVNVEIYFKSTDEETYLFIYMILFLCAESNLQGILQNITQRCDATEKIFLQGYKLWSQTILDGS